MGRVFSHHALYASFVCVSGPLLQSNEHRN